MGSFTYSIFPERMPTRADSNDACRIRSRYFGSSRDSLTLVIAAEEIEFMSDLRLVCSNLSIEVSMLLARLWKCLSKSFRELLKKLTRARFLTKSYSWLILVYSIYSLVLTRCFLYRVSAASAHCPHNWAYSQLQYAWQKMENFGPGVHAQALVSMLQMKKVIMNSYVKINCCSQSLSLVPPNAVIIQITQKQSAQRRMPRLLRDQDSQ